MDQTLPTCRLDGGGVGLIQATVFALSLQILGSVQLGALGLRVIMLLLRRPVVLQL